MTASQTLRAGKQALVDHGWIRGKAGSPDRGFCAVGALTFAARRSGNYNLAFQHLSQALPGRRVGLIARWNDRLWRRKRHVLALFDRAIAIAEAHEIDEGWDEISHLDFEPDIGQPRSRVWSSIPVVHAGGEEILAA
jgi:hypothetical protein